VIEGSCDLDILMNSKTIAKWDGVFYLIIKDAMALSFKAVFVRMILR
jgi:hypothetical protein